MVGSAIRNSREATCANAAEHGCAMGVLDAGGSAAEMLSCRRD